MDPFFSGSTRHERLRHARMRLDRMRFEPMRHARSGLNRTRFEPMRRARLLLKSALPESAPPKSAPPESAPPESAPLDPMIQHPFRTLCRDERGSVEAGLTFIPLTILFLVTMQLAFASQWGGARQANQQDLTNRIAITGSASGASSREVTDRIRYEPLVGGGYLVISERKEPVPLIANFAGVVPGELMYRKRVVSMSEVFTQ